MAVTTTTTLQATYLSPFLMDMTAVSLLTSPVKLISTPIETLRCLLGYKAAPLNISWISWNRSPGYLTLRQNGALR